MRLKSIIIACLVLGSVTGCQNKKALVSPHETEIEAIISRLTLEQKVGQMLNIGLPALLTGPFYSYRDTLILDSAKVENLLVKYGAGSVQNLGNFPLTPEQWRYIIDTIQYISKTRTHSGIPVLYGIDAVHGANYTAGSVLLPHQINLAASFNVEAATKVGEITAYEMQAGNIPWNYGPNLDVARHPMWGRIYESFGEDTYLTTQMGLAMIQGLQGTLPVDKYHAVACAKHFVGYGASYNGKDRSPVLMPENYVRQVLLPPFKTAIDHGLMSVMVSSGSLNGVPSHIDHNLLTKLLKNELGLKGAVITDWSDIDNLYSVHKVAANEREAVKMAVLAGIDICMEPYDESFAQHLIDLVNDGEVPMSRIDDAVRRILRLKFAAGLFETETAKVDYPDFASAITDSINLELAIESLTLLKNDHNILPLSANQKILVTGVAANSINYLNGGWSRSWSGQDTMYNDRQKLTIVQAISALVGKNKVRYAAGTGYTDGNFIADAVKQAQWADKIVVCVGEKPATEKPSDIDEIDLPAIQQELVKALAKTGKPIVLVMIQGRPRIIRDIEPLAGAILMAYLPGNEGGKAIANVLLGHSNPSGKLPYTYPRYSGSLWTYDHLLSDERDVNFGLNGFTPQYEFGYGLSYTTFEYSNLTLLNDTVTDSDTIWVSVNLKNTGTLTGKESVLLFVSDEVASVSPPVKQLKRFTKIALQPNEQKTITFELTARDLMFVNPQNQWVNESGYFTITLGTQKTRFYLRK